jgi:hypothetical protein
MQVPSVDHHVLHSAPEGDRGNSPVRAATIPNSLGALLISTQNEAE